MKNKVRKKICVVTGTRADYGIYLPVLKEIGASDNLDLELLVTGMHLSPTYGSTYKEIEKDGFKIMAKVDNLIQGATGGNMARSIALAIMGMTQAFEQSTPDIILVLGDRGEMLAAAIAASHLNIPICHLHGGEVSGSIDESVRHSITKLSHIHFASTQKSAERIHKLGEDAWRIHEVGAPRIDTILKTKLPDINNVFHQYQINFNSDEGYILFVFHPVSTEFNNIESQIHTCIEVLKESNKNVIIILPNSDAGTDKIIEQYNNSFRENDKFTIVTNFSPLEYLTVLKNSLALVGNSSSGIIEAASFHIPVVNIGDRQNGREKPQNVIDVSLNKSDIKSGMEKALSSEFREELLEVSNIYGNGTASEKIVQVLLETSYSDRLIKKVITY
ncbi:UDP-N-acetylglucosamine 2-epimerase [Radiobacillus kanasensis]|uniref:UDP-N-acetylglucosamine 2-epimerase n=1 Tax=Radiobacillus kanasensis TaxID=2844358 RepID=UPI001E3C10E1|nr:UDP-N-acetylglucosamine 2-epimerase [Radiobacillus kanasensis]UFT98886.1 UDP-N-acetylglucosamine 2-epimerase [Radiobacillus kanasensis]